MNRQALWDCKLFAYLCIGCVVWMGSITPSRFDGPVILILLVVMIVIDKNLIEY